MDLDPRDIKLLAALEEDGRLTGDELSKAIHLSGAQCSRRRARLEQEGVIAGYGAVLDNTKLGLSFVVFMSVTLTSHEADVLEEFANILAGMPQVLEAYMVGGDYDYLLKVVTRGPDDLHRLITSRLLPSKIVARIHSNFALKRLKLRGSLALSLLDNGELLPGSISKANSRS